MDILRLRTNLPGLLFCVIFLSFASAKQKVNLIYKYEGVVIAIHPDVPEDERLINEIKEMMVNASEDMYKATRYRAYFKYITILVPKSWTRGSYKPASSLTFDKADIRIAPPDKELDHEPNYHNPYVSPITKCGEQGNYIHLTPEYVMNDNISSNNGPRGKVMVHEWAHYRWGVKDEYYTPGVSNKRFYRSPTSGKVEATRCTVNIRGRLSDRGDECQYDVRTGLPILRCRFIPDKTQAKGVHGSLMYQTLIPQVSTFCHDDPSDPLNMHNEEAPNSQNNMCDRRSTWDVIMDSVDFERGERNIPGKKNQVTVPMFTIAKAHKRRIVFVLDSSSSMSGEKMKNLRRALKMTLSSLIPDGTFVGLVEFYTIASVLSPLKEFKQGGYSEVTLMNALQDLFPWGQTAIGEGIMKGIQVLEEQSANGGKLIVVTDGEENEGPTVASITEEVVSKGVIVDFIFFGLAQNAATESLQQLSELTGGDWYNIENSYQKLYGAFAAAVRPDDGDLSSVSVLISASVHKIQGGKEINSKVAIDGSVGKQTSFMFTWSKGITPPNIKLTSPHGSCIYSNFHTRGGKYCRMVVETDVELQTVTIDIPGEAKMGYWKYNVISDEPDDFTVTVTSAASAKGIYPVTLIPEINTANVSGSEPAVIKTTVSQNTNPVLGAKVEAKITRPKGDPVTLILFDNGSGADVTKNDGVYSRYFSQFNFQGRYSIQVTVFKNGNDPVGVPNIPRAPKEILNDGTFVSIAGVNMPKQINGVKIKGSLQRIATSSGLAYSGVTQTLDETIQRANSRSSYVQVDIYPPNKISDLEVKQLHVDYANATLQLEFTAPGDDYDIGSAARYDIRYTYGSPRNLLTHFTTQLVAGLASHIKPQIALNGEEIPISVPVSQTETVVRITFAIRSFDKGNNPSTISNLASVTFFTKQQPPPPSSACSAFSVNLCGLLGALAVTLSWLYRDLFH